MEITKMPTSEWLNKLHFQTTEDNAAIMNEDNPLFDGHGNIIAYMSYHCIT